jgi:hypothetical protein
MDLFADLFPRCQRHDYQLDVLGGAQYPAKIVAVSDRGEDVREIVPIVSGHISNLGDGTLFRWQLG